MGQEYFINSQQLQDKLADLLPSQGGAGSGFDLSASTQIIPVIDVTESAEGSNLRQDLQTSYGINSTASSVSGATSTIISTTGYFRLFGLYRSISTSSTTTTINITDGITSTTVASYQAGTLDVIIPFDFNIFLSAGDSCNIIAGAGGRVLLTHRQIADINGDLVNP